MKYLALAIGLIGILPLSFLLKSSPYARTKFWILLGVFPFVFPIFPILDLEIITWDGIWRGHVSGLLISAIDLIAIAIYFAVKHQANSIPHHFPFLIYSVAISLSVFQADVPHAALFYVWQFMRIYFLTVVIAKACTDETVPTQLLKGFAIGLGIQIFFVIWQKFGLNIIQPSGTFVHQNTLGLIMHMVVFPHFALLLTGPRPFRNAAVPFVGLMIAAMIASRAALGFSVFGFVATYFLSLLRRWTSWKILIGVLGIMSAAALTPVAYSAMEKRFITAPPMEHEYDERAAFNRAALSMLELNPLGIGVNHYSYVGKNYGYSVRAGVSDAEGSLSNIVHNAYLLAAAEAGYFGFLAFAMLMFYPMSIAFRYSWVARTDPKGDLLLGLGVAMLSICLHSLFEYIIVIKETQYALAVLVGMTFGLAHQVKQVQRSEQLRSGDGSRNAIHSRRAGRLLR